MAQWQRSVFGIVKSQVRFLVGLNGFILDFLSRIRLRIILRGAKIPQFHSKYFKFRMCIGLTQCLLNHSDPAIPQKRLKGSGILWRLALLNLISTAPQSAPRTLPPQWSSISRPCCARPVLRLSEAKQPKQILRRRRASTAAYRRRCCIEALSAALMP